MSPRISLAPSLSVFAAALLAACSGSSPRPSAPPARLVVTATTFELAPTSEPLAFDPATVGAERVDAYYRLTTPSDVPMQVDLSSWAEATHGTASVSLRHVADDGNAPFADGFSLARAGLGATGNGLTSDGTWLAATGDGFSRLSLQGRIARPQRFAVRADGLGVTVIDVVIGAASEINRPSSSEPDATGVLSNDTIYSSDSWQFGLPAIAISGDRTSIVCYEGDRAQPSTDRRFEQRLQHDRLTGAVTGGASSLSSADSGNWRDHETFALYNVLGVVRGEAEGPMVRLSYDRGATFAQEVRLWSSPSPGRLVQTAIASDYSLAITGWRDGQDSAVLEFVLVEGRPVAFDAVGSPTWFQFDVPQVLYSTPALAVVPLTTGIAWSEGGDLAIGYGVNKILLYAGSTLEARCAVRRYGEPLVDTRVALERRSFGFDPSVAVVGQGTSLRVFCAYESMSGIGLATSEDGGHTFGTSAFVGLPGAHQPSVFARETNGVTRVDLLYLAPRQDGIELHRAFWTDWATSAPIEQALTRSSVVREVVNSSLGGPTEGWVMRSVNWFGYDAVRDGDHIVVVYDEVTTNDVARMDWLLVLAATASTAATGGIYSPSYSHATPPPLAPGLTLAMPAPNPAHAHQLKLLRLQ